jgi:hypothetical protein
LNFPDSPFHRFGDFRFWHIGLSSQWT